MRLGDKIGGKVGYGARVVRTDYLHEVFDPERFRDTIAKAHDRLKEFEQEYGRFEAIAFRGMSGAALAFPLAALMNKGLLCVRKPNDSSHSWYEVEGLLSARSYVIVDDFMDTGETIEAITNEIASVSRAEYRGVYFYRKHAGVFCGSGAPPENVIYAHKERSMA